MREIITANTVQNSEKFLSVNPVDTQILQQQVSVLIDDKPPSVVKIGLLANIEQVKWLTSALADITIKYPALNIVLIPLDKRVLAVPFHNFSAKI